MKKCPKCEIPVKSYFTYCPSCGARLRKDTIGSSSLRLFFIVGLLLLVAVSYVVFFQKVERKTWVPGSDKTVSNSHMIAKKNAPFSQILFASPETDSPANTLSAGTIIIYDIARNEVSRLAAAVSESGWVAIPARYCVRGYSWYFYPAGGEEIEILSGILGDRDDTGLWQLKNSSRLSGPPISPVRLNSPVVWESIVSEKNMQLAGVSILSEQQNFYQIFLPESTDEPGVLMQDQKIVGWTFGENTDGGYLWKGPDESNLVVELNVYDFYRLTFENSREEQFIIGYASKEMRPGEQLEIFANGFKLDSVLAEENTPDYLKSKSVVAKMRSIIARILDEENFYDIASVSDSRVLAETGDVSFIIDVLTLGSQVNGPAYSVEIIQQVLDAPAGLNESRIYQIRVFQKELYRKWLTLLMDAKDYQKGFDVYEQAARVFADDPEIHLHGIKLALVFNDWETAEEILSSHSFPIDLTDQVRILEDQIADLKFQENKIVVRFSRDSGRIPVAGLLNNRLQQDFVIDTGASMVTIPSKAARQLGIKIDGATPVRELITAGGIIEAPQITLHSIELDGWTEYNVTAYVVDMPNQSGFGLLGLNYLNRFRMDLNTESGVLTLAPRSGPGG